MNVNAYLSRQYSAQPCWDLVADLYATECTPVHVGYTQQVRTVRDMSAAFRLAIHNSPHGFVRVADPVDYAIVLLGKHTRVGIHHCGVYYQGSVLHALPGITLFEPLSVIRDAWELIEFWAQPVFKPFSESAPS